MKKMTPKGHLNCAARVLKRLARAGDIDGFRAYVRSDTFGEAMVGVGPTLRQSLLRLHTEYAALCEAYCKLPPLPKPKRRATGRWINPSEQAKLAQAYRAAGNDHEKAGRLLGCTAGAARLARKRYLGETNPQMSAAA